MEPLQYLPFSSKIAIDFWHKLTEQKLDHMKLSEASINICGDLTVNPTVSRAIASIQFERQSESSPQEFEIHGSLQNRNSLESFKNCDKRDLLHQVVLDHIVNPIKSGEALNNPAMLNRFMLLSFADLKEYHFYHWTAYPSASLPTELQVLRNCLQPLNASFTPEQMENLATICGRSPFILLNKKSLQPVDFSVMKTSNDFFIVFADPSPDDNVVGWPLRNFLLLVSFHMPNDVEDYEVIALRGARVRHFEKSRRLTVQVRKSSLEQIIPVGWERNEKGQYGPRFLDLAATMNPELLAKSAVDLNLKLMRWRLAPELNLEHISSTKCLLLGAGTLGCNVARCLMGWGVRKITFVDNGKVSYSNPVRQSLYTFEDSLKGGKAKAAAAAESCRKIFPQMDVNSVQLTIPMPGHVIGEGDIGSTEDSVNQLEELIKRHDVVFLLLDTREARWLPTVMGRTHGKIVLNAALGFDTFLVMRHGTAVNKLGCYFCNDVVGPTNSVRDRTLDQQCTVSRPGVSFMAASLVVEMMAALLQHENGADSQADNPCDDADGDEEQQMETKIDNVLGLIPHQIRCFLNRYHFMTPKTESFTMCTACSPSVLSAYEEDGFDFLLKVFNEENHLEHVTGLTKMYEAAEEIDLLELPEDIDGLRID